MSEKCIIAIGKCVNINMNYLQIHFKGYYLGHYIKCIQVNFPEHNGEVKIGKEYILYLQKIRVEKSELHGELIYSKEINDPI